MSLSSAGVAGPAADPDLDARPEARVAAYLDHAATTPMLATVIDAMDEQFQLTGNASSLHAAGRRARRTVEESRERIAAALSARPSEVVFTAGGTESDNLAASRWPGVLACEQLEQGIRKGRWGIELAFPYHPHVTIAHDIEEAELDRAFDELAQFVAIFEVQASTSTSRIEVGPGSRSASSRRG